VLRFLRSDLASISSTLLDWSPLKMLSLTVVAICRAIWDRLRGYLFCSCSPVAEEHSDYMSELKLTAATFKVAFRVAFEATCQVTYQVA